MKQSEAAAFLPLIKAWSEGKTLQVRTSSNPVRWQDVDRHFDFHFQKPENYRVKPSSRTQDVYVYFFEDGSVAVETEPFVGIDYPVKMVKLTVVEPDDFLEINYQA